MTSLYCFHVNLFAEPGEASFACTWEDAATQLQRLPRMIFEPDGSFILSGDVPLSQRAGPAPAPARWQVDGHLFDFAGRLHRVELHGDCPPAVFDDLLRCLGWPGQPLRFEMVREGIVLDEPAFRERVAT